MRNATKKVLLFLIHLPLGLLTMVAYLFLPKRRTHLVWGPDPILNNSYWSRAMQAVGWPSCTVMSTYYSINQRDDFDVFYDDLVPKWVRPQAARLLIGPFLAFLYIVRRARVVHLPFHGGPLGKTWLWRFEAQLLHLAGIKIVVIPYGADAYMYSQVIDTSLRQGLLLSYPMAARNELRIQRRVRYWNEQADVVFTGLMVDGMGRWDIPVPSILMIDTEKWAFKGSHSGHDGRSSPVKVIHTPNHRGFKGTEFLVHAVEELRQEGLQIELVLLEKVPNSRVRELMQESDILAEQFIATGYALSGIEGMASGLPVMANLEHEAYTRVFRRYSYLDECPILSTAPETLKRNLRILVTQPELRRQLGKAGRAYVEKYHSYGTAQYLFGAIYQRILENEPVDLMNLFHPLRSEWNRKTPRVEHPLVENRLPEGLLRQLEGE